MERYDNLAGSDSVYRFGSVERRQAKELGLKLLHAPESQCGLLGKAAVQVVVGNHHHLHPRSERRLHAVGSVFKHQTLSKDRGEGNKMILSYKPIRSTGFHPCTRHKAETKKQTQEKWKQEHCFHLHVTD